MNTASKLAHRHVILSRGDPLFAHIFAPTRNHSLLAGRLHLEHCIRRRLASVLLGLAPFLSQLGNGSNRRSGGGWKRMEAGQLQTAILVQVHIVLEYFWNVESGQVPALLGGGLTTAGWVKCFAGNPFANIRPAGPSLEHIRHRAWRELRMRMCLHDGLAALVTCLSGRHEHAGLAPLVL
jgi:hypothetical protein